jgi:hypothetical protein
MSQASQSGYKRMTVKEVSNTLFHAGTASDVQIQRQEEENQRSRLQELRRLILTSSNVEDEESGEADAKVCQMDK